MLGPCFIYPTLRRIFTKLHCKYCYWHNGLSLLNHCHNHLSLQSNLYQNEEMVPQKLNSTPWWDNAFS